MPDPQHISELLPRAMTPTPTSQTRPDQCDFTAGSLWCINDPCTNPRHRNPVPTVEHETVRPPLADLPCLTCGTNGRSRLLGYCPPCEATHRNERTGAFAPIGTAP